MKAFPGPSTNSGGAATSWSISPALPAGLGLNPASGYITGTPVAASAKATYTVTASNAAGGGQASIMITVSSGALGALTWKRDVIYFGSKEVAEIEVVNGAAGISVTLTDHLGSPRLKLRADGTVLEQKFMPFGESLTDPTTMKTFAKGFTNHEQTDPSGLIYMQARFYAPMYHRFLSPDPARDQHFEETQSWNIYSYVRNNPIHMSDPTGLEGDPTPGTAPITIKMEQNSAGKANNEQKNKAQTEGQRLTALIPQAVKNAIQKSVDASNAPTGDDKKGGFHEEGGLSITNGKGETEIHPAVSGAYSPPGATSATVEINNLVTPLPQDIKSIDVHWHVHPAGVDTSIEKVPGGTLTHTRSFDQHPSIGPGKDTSNADFATINLVVGARDKMVYFYDKSGEIGKIPLSEFTGK